MNALTAMYIHIKHISDEMKISKMCDVSYFSHIMVVVHQMRDVWLGEAGS